MQVIKITNANSSHHTKSFGKLQFIKYQTEQKMPASCGRQHHLPDPEDETTHNMRHSHRSPCKINMPSDELEVRMTPNQITEQPHMVLQLASFCRGLPGEQNS